MKSEIGEWLKYRVHSHSGSNCRLFLTEVEKDAFNIKNDGSR